MASPNFPVLSKGIFLYVNEIGPLTASDSEMEQGNMKAPLDKQTPQQWHHLTNKRHSSGKCRGAHLKAPSATLGLGPSKAIPR